MDGPWSQLFADHVEGALPPNDEGWVSAFCPFHESASESKSRSFGFNVTHGHWICRGGCTLDEAKGDAIKFAGLMQDRSFRNEKTQRVELAGALLEKYPGLQGAEGIAWYKPQAAKGTPPDKTPFDLRAMVQKWHQKLMEDDVGGLAYLTEERLWSREIIEKYKIGSNPNRRPKRFTIPVKSRGGQLGVREYAPGNSDRKFLWNKEGFTRNCAFPNEAFHGDVLYVTEGEPDCLALLSRGWNAVTFTAGASSLPRPDDLKRFARKVVVILYDADAPGRAGAEKLARTLLGTAERVKVIDLAPLLPEGHKDVTDGLRDRGDTFVEDLRARIDATPFYAVEVTAEEVRTYDDAGFVDLTSPDRFGSDISVQSVLLGTSALTYRAYRSIAIECDQVSGGEHCEQCPLMGRGKARYPDSGSFDDLDLLEQIKVARYRLKKLVKSQPGGPWCEHWDIDESKSDGVKVAELILGPEVMAGGIDEETPIGLAQQPAYAILRDGAEPLQLNQLYRFSGQPLADPQNQAIVMVVAKHEPVEGDLGGFVLSRKMGDKIRKIRDGAKDRAAASGTAVMDKPGEDPPS